MKSSTFTASGSAFRLTILRPLLLPKRRKKRFLTPVCRGQVIEKRHNWVTGVMTSLPDISATLCDRRPHTSDTSNKVYAVNMSITEVHQIDVCSSCRTELPWNRCLSRYNSGSKVVLEKLKRQLALRFHNNIVPLCTTLSTMAAAKLRLRKTC
ncbi:hypothetical protein J6590_034160 [Homalodisca vitripennis]|nr:hypothetical protein J6590_034160 [Homalodisca vitripennis]